MFAGGSPLDHKNKIGAAQWLFSAFGSEERKKKKKRKEVKPNRIAKKKNPALQWVVRKNLLEALFFFSFFLCWEVVLGVVARLPLWLLVALFFHTFFFFFFFFFSAGIAEFS